MFRDEKDLGLRRGETYTNIFYPTFTCAYWWHGASCISISLRSQDGVNTEVLNNYGEVMCTIQELSEFVEFIEELRLGDHA
jgi:hypothetical protein